MWWAAADPAIPCCLFFGFFFYPRRCREGDLVTIASRGDLQRAMQEAVEAAQKVAGARLPLTPSSLPPIRVQVVRVSSEVSWLPGHGGLGTWQQRWQHQSMPINRVEGTRVEAEGHREERACVSPSPPLFSMGL